VISNLGTIAKSGTREFLNALLQNKNQESNFIGQFGVGFYSCFVVAREVYVKTRRAGMKSDQGVLWRSTGEGEYTIENIDKPDRGTEVILFLKDEDKEFLDSWRLRSIIRKYSDHILLPILMEEQKHEGEKKKENTAAKEESKFETINKATALWALSKKEIKDSDYQEFYKHVAHDFENPLLWSHNFVEGKLEYTTLLYIPSRPTFDLWSQEKRHGLKLYVQRVFIMDDAEQLLPSYLRFIRGIVDSKDLPLNVSREILQNNKVIDAIRSGICKRVLEMLQKLTSEDPEKYRGFWKNFGKVLKEGIVEDYSNKDTIAKLLRFASTHQDTEEQLVSLDEYIKRMPKEQEKIYYIIADSHKTAKNSPHLEIFNKKGIEVLLLSDRVDEWMLNSLLEYEGKKLHSVAKGGLELGDLEDKQVKDEVEKARSQLEDVIKQMKKVLGEKVKEVRVTYRLTDSPACLVAEENSMSLHLQRMIEAAGQSLPKVAPILEINPEHPIILRLKNEQDDVRFAEWSEILFDQALLAEGGHLEDSAMFVKRLNKLLLELAV
jgi:molecular chaperone HtpG